MNSLIESEFPLHEAQKLRYDLMAALTDSDLAYKLPGDNPTMGELCREIGELEHCYIQSFKSHQHDLSYRSDDPKLATSVERLTNWYRSLDQEFETVVRGLSEEQLHNVVVDRGNGFTPSLFVQFHIYREALLMFYAKASVYLKGLQKSVNDQWQVAIG